MKQLYHYRFNLYIREGVGHSHTKHLPPNFSTPNPLIKLLTPHLNPTFLLLPSNKKRREKTQPKVQFIYKEGLVSAESSPSENLEGSIHIGVFSSQTNIQNNHKQNIFGSK